MQTSVLIYDVAAINVSPILLNPLFFASDCSTVLRADKGKPIERWGRKASGLTTHVYDSGVAA